MKPFLFQCALLSCLFLAPHAYGWNGSDHRALTRLALEDVQRDWRLDRPVAVHPLKAFLDKLTKIRPELGDLWHWADYLQINTKTNIEKLPRELAGRGSLTPVEILTLASVDPDDGRDQDLIVRDEKGDPHYAYPDQKWFGVMTGSNSQAFRHIEKPPFSLQHPLSTFGLPFRAVGESTLRAEIYFQASRLAFSLGEDYWGWRLLGGSLHYLEDLHQPYHAGQITPALLARGIAGYLTWGHKQFGLMGTLSHLVANSHRFFESYIAIPSGDDTGVKREALDVLKGRTLSPWPGSARTLAIQVRDASNLYFPGLVHAVTEATDPILMGPIEFESDDEGQSDPGAFLRKGDDFEEANRRIFKITRNRFESAGQVIRTIVHESLNRPTQSGAQEILQKLDGLLHPTSS